MMRKNTLTFLIAAIFLTVVFPKLSQARSLENHKSQFKIFNINSSNPGLKEAAIFYASKTKNLDYEPKICSLLINSKLSNIRNTAAQALCQYQNPYAEECLLKALKLERDKNVREEIVLSLTNFTDTKISKCMCKLLNDHDAKIKHYALTSLENFKNSCNQKISTIVKSPNTNYKLKLLASQVLGMHKYKTIQGYMLKLLSSKNIKSQKVAMKYFKFYPNPATIPVIKRILNSNIVNNSYKMLAFNTLISLNNLKAIEAIKNLFLLPQYRKALAWKLPVLKAKLPKGIIDELIHDNRPIVRIALLTYLGRQKIKNYCNFIKKNIYSKNPNITVAAMWATSKIQCPKGIKNLSVIIANMNNNDSMRKLAAKDICKFSPERLRANREVLKELYDDEIFDDIKAIIAEALNKADGK